MVVLNILCELYFEYGASDGSSHHSKCVSYIVVLTVERMTSLLFEM
jgi:hypothetical protein